MDVLGQRERSWRKGRKRGVSPIIATILLVAITVVLAAVLYILISGLTKGPGNTPIGSAFGMGTPVQVQPSAAQPGQCAATTDFCYEIAIAEASSGITAGGIQFKITTNSGSTTLVAVPTTYIYDSAVNGYLTSATNPTGAWTVTAGTGGAAVEITSTTPLATTMTVWIQFTASPYGLGYSLVAYGTGSFSSQTTAITLP
jgi:flagellin-like protein